MPDTLTLAKLDRVVQAAMGWTNSHLHDWHIDGKRYGAPDPEWDNEGDMLDERRSHGAHRRLSDSTAEGQAFKP